MTKRFGFLNALLILICSSSFSQPNLFDYKRYLFGSAPTITLYVLSIDTNTGVVTIHGVDTGAPSTPYTWRWGDGNTTTGFFSQSHTYTNRSKNHIVEVIGTYSGGTKDSNEVLVRFVPPEVAPIAIPNSLGVIIPENKPILESRLYTPPKQLTAFNNSFFATVSREILEYVLSVCALIQNDFTNSDMFLYNEKFEQVMLRDSTFGGAYSLWYTNPVAFGVGESFLQGAIGYSSLFHEMGHNFTLNMPGDYYYGGRIDGNANAIFSESMANIFQHAAAYEIVNNYQSYGLSSDLMFEIKQSAVSSVGTIRGAYGRYVTHGKPFASWNDPSTRKDETFDTFMTIAYKFLEKAETSSMGYKTPLKRMTLLLQGFNPQWAQRYDRMNNNAAADTFRATLLSTAISFAFSTDMRNEFRSLNFPIDDIIYYELYNSVTSVERSNDLRLPKYGLSQNYPNPFNPNTVIEFSVPYETFVTLRIYDILGREVETLVAGEVASGNHIVRWDGSRLPSGVYIYRLSADHFTEVRKQMLLK